MYGIFATNPSVIMRQPLDPIKISMQFENRAIILRDL